MTKREHEADQHRPRRVGSAVVQTEAQIARAALRRDELRRNELLSGAMLGDVGDRLERRRFGRVLGQQPRDGILAAHHDASKTRTRSP